MASLQAYRDYKNMKITEKDGKFYIGDCPTAYSSKEKAEEAHKIALEIISF